MREGIGDDICQCTEDNSNSFATSEQFGEGLRVERVAVEFIQHRVSKVVRSGLELAGRSGGDAGSQEKAA